MHISDWSSDVCSSDLYRLAAENTYDVIVLDLMLPRLDGIEVCKRLREEARKSTPVLMLTARDTLDEKLTALVEHFDGRLEIPIGRASCRERVCQYVSISVVAVVLKNTQPTEPH